jgi:hypothetical protein
MGNSQGDEDFPKVTGEDFEILQPIGKGTFGKVRKTFI